MAEMGELYPGFLFAESFPGVAYRTRCLFTTYQLVLPQHGFHSGILHDHMLFDRTNSGHTIPRIFGLTQSRFQPGLITWVA